MVGLGKCVGRIKFAVQLQRPQLTAIKCKTCGSFDLQPWKCGRESEVSLVHTILVSFRWIREVSRNCGNLDSINTKGAKDIKQEIKY